MPYKKKMQKKRFKNDHKPIPDSTRHQNEGFQTTFQLTKSIRDPSKGFRPNFRKIQILPFPQCGNGNFNHAGKIQKKS